MAPGPGSGGARAGLRGVPLGLRRLAPATRCSLVGNLCVFMPLYGCPALLIREIARRRGLGWPGIAAAGRRLRRGGGRAGRPVDVQPRLPRHPLLARHAAPTYVEPIGLSIFLAVTFVAGHVVNSICAPIALVEGLAGPRGQEPWLGRPMIVVATLLYLAASALVLPDHFATEATTPRPASWSAPGSSPRSWWWRPCSRRSPAADQRPAGRRARGLSSSAAVAVGRGRPAAAALTARHRRPDAVVRRGGRGGLAAVPRAGLVTRAHRRARRRHAGRRGPRLPDRPARATSATRAKLGHNVGLLVLVAAVGVLAVRRAGVRGPARASVTG